MTSAPHIVGFPPVANRRARVLILGSMPGQKSLHDSEYYAHPRNAFWPIMQAVLGIDATAEYTQRLQALKQARVALWDTLHACHRRGSLDADIEQRDLLANDFNALFEACPRIGQVLFNGLRAEQEYRRQVLPGLGSDWKDLPMERLPSTSPAHASMRFEAKCEAWRRALEAALAAN